MTKPTTSPETVTEQIASERQQLATLERRTAERQTQINKCVLEAKTLGELLRSYAASNPAVLEGYLDIKILRDQNGNFIRLRDGQLRGYEKLGIIAVTDENLTGLISDRVVGLIDRCQRHR